MMARCGESGQSVPKIGLASPPPSATQVQVFPPVLTRGGIYPRERRVTLSRQTRIEATGPTALNTSKRIASVTSGCRSPT